MYRRSFYKDHVTDAETGEVIQEGTLLDQAHFNNSEGGIYDAHLATLLLLDFAKQNHWEIEKGTIALTNNKKYPFNSSLKSVALKQSKENDAYLVLAEAVESDGNVGEIVVQDKLTNGFKIGYNGSAKSATVNYTVIGGYLK